jgi:cation:H+ antiporter
MIGPSLLILGLLGLWGGTLLAVRGAVLLSHKHGWSQGFVGLTVMSIGTDLPELFIAVDASVQQLRGIEASGIIVGNAIGSTMAQATLVVGAAGLAHYLSVAPSMVRRDGTTLLLATFMALLLGFDGMIDRLEGSVLLIAYALYLIALSQGRRGEQAGQPGATGFLPPSLLILIGLATVILGSHVSVTEAVALVETWGMSQTLVGVLILGLGTSLPELALSVGAARQGHGSLAVGNAIGSCVFDLMVPLGLAAMLHPLLVSRETIIFDLPALAFGSAVLLFFLFRRKGLQRREAWSLLVLYGVYVATRTIVG